MIYQADQSLKAKQETGFTYIEVLVVLIVIGILSGISYVALATTRTNTNQSSCKTAYQALALAVSSYQNDNSGSLPPSVASLQPNYLSAGLVSSYSSKFTLQLGSFAVINEALSANTATLKISSSFTPPITVGETIQVSGVDSTNLDGTWTVSSISSSGSVYTITYAATSSATIPATAVSSTGAILNALTNTSNPFDVYVFNANGVLQSGTAPSACTSLT